MSYFLAHLGSSIPSIITGTEPKGTKAEVPRFLILKRTERFLFFRNRTSLRTKEPNRSVRLEPNAQPDALVLLHGTILGSRSEGSMFIVECDPGLQAQPSCLIELSIPVYMTFPQFIRYTTYILNYNSFYLF